MKKKLEVVAAAIIEDGKILCMQRPVDKDLANYWEFPGGKVEAGETHEDALIREIQEELETDIVVDDFVDNSVHEHDFAIIDLTIYTAHFAGTNDWVLTEHQDYKWLKPSELHDLNWPHADRNALKKLSGLDLS